ncbi:Anterior-restricted homeobox [Hyphodiscus hymeniophilus]|uniref:Anterior-restricted homeobox n=1 Tax=Hyphodiscus hymeniophilus TaxID=353542 RepID=A0A9P6VK45_9HELO|nr:Anterior-restricted homeobox [Hyphodiscus hymeniophilus]
MEYLEPSFHHFHDQMAQGISPYSEAHQQHLQHSYAMAQQTSTMITMPNHQTRANETKPRLGKEEVEILEHEFKKNPKPTTQTKRGFAEDMGVELARINNWFQNRRAKRKQERKQEAYEAGQAQESLAYSEPSSPDNFYGSSYFSDSNILPLQHAATFPLMGGPPPPPVASCNPQYPDPSSASMESLQRTMAAAQAASQHQEFIGQFQEEHESMTNFGGPLLEVTTSDDRAQFPAGDDIAHFEENNGFPSYNSSFQDDYYSPPNQHLPEPQHPSNTNQISTPFHNYSAASGDDTNGSNVLVSFPSQLLPLQSHDGLSSQLQENHDSQSPEESNTAALSIDFRYDVAESESPPAPTVSFKSPPPPTDLASRRKKAVKPAALAADTLRGRPSLGPRTVSHAEGFRRPSDSPMSSPMRRIVSAGGNRSVVSGRVGKSGVESAQRSPINMNGFADARSFMDHNYHTTRQPPSLIAGSSLNSSLAPPTPMSPREREMTLVTRDGSRSTASPVENGMNFVFNTGVPGCFTSIEDQNLASPPETPQAHLAMHHLGNGWPTAVDFQDKQWHFEVPDEPLYTPAYDSFPIELHMPQPSYLSSLSQPVTPAFGQFNPNFMFGSESPQYKTESPQYQLTSRTNSEYSFPDSHYGGMMSTSPMTKQKTFQFSNTTAADFSEK